MTRAAAVTTLYGRERSIFFLALMFCLMASSAYIYFLCSTVVQVVIREEIDAEIAETSGRIADLEMQYIAGKHAVTLALAAEYGFTEKPEREYLARASTNLVFHTDTAIE